MSEEASTVHARAIEKLRRDLGSVIVTALADPRTVEVMMNADGSIWHERLGEPMKRIGDIAAQRTEAIIKTVAGYLDKTVTRHSPLIEGELPLDGSRFAGQLPPVVQAPTIAIRKKAIAVFTLDQYVDQGVLTDHQATVLKDAVADYKNILVIGGTGSGKTTLVNAIIHEMSLFNPHERVCIIEDTGELQCSADNYVQYHTTFDVNMTMLLKTILRMRPDRILVGEVRGSEALDLLDAWNTGHEGGAATLHANDARSALTRLKSLVTRHEFAPSDIETLIGQTVHLIVSIARTPEGRRVQEITKLSGYQEGHYQTHLI